MYLTTWRHLLPKLLQRTLLQQHICTTFENYLYMPVVRYVPLFSGRVVPHLGIGRGKISNYPLILKNHTLKYFVIYFGYMAPNLKLYSTNPVRVFYAWNLWICTCTGQGHHFRKYIGSASIIYLNFLHSKSWKYW